MYRSAKEHAVTLPEHQLLSCGMEEAAAMSAAEWGVSEWSAAYTSASEQLKRTPKKPSR